MKFLLSVSAHFTIIPDKTKKETDRGEASPFPRSSHPPTSEPGQRMSISLDSTPAPIFYPSDLSAVLQQLPAFVAVFATSGELLWTNRAGYGTDTAGVVGKTITELFPTADLTSWHAAFQRASVGIPCSFRHRLPVPTPLGYADFTGEIGPIDLRGVRHIVSIAWDVTAKHRTDEDPLLTALLSPECKVMVRMILDKGRTKSPALLRSLANQSATKVRILLRNLVDRGILNHDDQGYDIVVAIRPMIADSIR